MSPLNLTPPASLSGHASCQGRIFATVWKLVLQSMSVYTAIGRINLVGVLASHWLAKHGWAFRMGITGQGL